MKTIDIMAILILALTTLTACNEGGDSNNNSKSIRSIRTKMATIDFHYMATCKSKEAMNEFYVLTGNQIDEFENAQRNGDYLSSVNQKYYRISKDVRPLIRQILPFDLYRYEDLSSPAAVERYLYFTRSRFRILKTSEILDSKVFLSDL